ncbi:porin [Marinobacter nauticus]|uniref:Porin domain-containing protein n=1 Tax=Marinobacter nauticus TaxID=2743 RepID=A0A1M2V1A7_MARNT|nr:porin [Marinobacter nauticus]OJT01375.1 hypothetical protein BEE62_02825 [Marinobacter nauticus]
MKKQLLALAIGSMVVAPSVAMADKGPTVYGKVNVSYENQDRDRASFSNDAWRLQSNASRLGVKGELDLNIEDVVAVYQAEYQINVDDGGTPFEQRNIFGGFKHATAGTLIAGNFDTPLKRAEMKVDQFGDTPGDIDFLMAGQLRAKNIIQYSSPKLADMLTLNVAFIPGEEFDDVANPDANDGPADAISASLTFQKDIFYGAIAYDSETTTRTRGGSTPRRFVDSDGGAQDPQNDILRFVAGVNTSAFEAGFLYQLAEGANNNMEDTSYLVSGAFKTGNLKLKAQYGLTEGDLTDEERSLWALGADYKVGKNSKVYAFLTEVEEDLSEDKDTTFGIGFDHKFSM